MSKHRYDIVVDVADVRQEHGTLPAPARWDGYDLDRAITTGVAMVERVERHEQVAGPAEPRAKGQGQLGG